MIIKTDNKEGITILSFEGRLDSNTSPDVQDKVLPMISKGIKLVLDMKNCDYLSSAGLRILMMIGKLLNREGGAGVLSGLNSELQDIMEMAGFGQVFKNYDNLDDAISAVRV